MSEWKDFRLTQVGMLKRGKSKHRPRYAFHLYGGKYPFIQTGEIKTANKFIDHFENTYSEAGLAQSHLWPAGTLCITIAANIAETAILTFDACFPDSVIGFIPNNDKCDLDFAFYLLKHFQRELQVFGDGSVQDNINLGTFEQITFPFPPVPEQHIIAGVLSSLDDKIDLLHRQNKTLEAMAESLWRKMFVEEVNPNWDERGLDEIALFLNGLPCQKYPPDTSTESLPVIKIRELRTGITDDSDMATSKVPLEYIIYDGDILFSWSGSLEVVIWSFGKGVLNQHLFKVTSVNYPKWFYYYWIKNHLAEFRDIAQDKATTMGHIQRHHISAAKVLIPDKKSFEYLNSQISPIFDGIIHNLKAIRLLMNLRDTLLPKLMSGEVRMKYER